ncbi:MAG: hypothetical protein V4559_10875 [Pseudomonadota bacterium]
MGFAIFLTGIGLLSFVLYNFAVYAVPVYIGAWVGISAFHGGAGVASALAGLVAAVVVFLMARVALTGVNRALRWLTLALFAVPAAYAGYSIVLQLSEVGVPSPMWRHFMAILGACLVGYTASARLIAPEPGFERQEVA